MNKSLKKNSGKFGANHSQNLLQESNNTVDNIQNVHFMQIKSISKNFQTPVVSEKMIVENVESSESSEDEIKKELGEKNQELKIRKAELKMKDKQIKDAEKMIQFLMKAATGGDLDQNIVSY